LWAWNLERNEMLHGKALECGPYKPRTDRCMNHAPAILAVPALIYSTHRLDYCCRFHLCSLVGRYAVLEVYAVWWPMRVCCGSWWGWCVLFINIWDSLTAPCLVYNTAMYTVYGRCGQYGRCICSYTGRCGRCVVYTDPLNVTNARSKSTVNSSQRRQTRRSTRHTILRCDE